MLQAAAPTSSPAGSGKNSRKNSASQSSLNRPGAGSITGAAIVAKTSGDGYNLLMATVTTMSIHPNLRKKLPYDPEQDFVPVGMIAGTPFVLVISASKNVKTIAELAAYAQAQGRSLTYASGGVGTPHHLIGALISKRTGIPMTHVPYGGSGAAISDVIAGHVDMIVADVPLVIALIQDGKLTAVGTATKDRVSLIPNVPTLAEAGLSGADALGWVVLVAPSKTPRAIISHLNRDLTAVMREPDIRDQLKALALENVETLSPTDAAAYIRSETVRWGDIVRSTGISVE
jgi:tripartite-type tricarboxylate transporter receptor subunit TctC